MQRGAAAGDDLWVMLNRGSGGGPAPDLKSTDVSAETGMRAAYQMWKRMMS